MGFRARWEMKFLEKEEEMKRERYVYS